MDVVNTRNFGLLIAYVIPGFVCLLGAGTTSDAVWVWLVGTGSGGPSMGGVLYVGIASVGAGMTASVARWAVLDTAHHLTGLPRPTLDESRLTERLEAFHYLVEQHYRYYQFYGNNLIALVAAYGMWCSSPHANAAPTGWVEAGLLVLCGVFAAGSRDALRKYYTGSVLLLGTLQRRRSRMTNGKHHPTHQKAPQLAASSKSPVKKTLATAGSSRNSKVESTIRKS